MEGMTYKEFRQCLKRHGYMSSSDEDSGGDTNLDFQKRYEKYRPPPIKIDPNIHRIIEIGPSDEKPTTSFERNFPKLEKICHVFRSDRSRMNVDESSKRQGKRNEETHNARTVENKVQKTDENDNSTVGSRNFLGLSKSQKRNKRRRLSRMSQEKSVLDDNDDDVDFTNAQTKDKTVGVGDGDCAPTKNEASEIYMEKVTIDGSERNQKEVHNVSVGLDKKENINNETEKILNEGTTEVPENDDMVKFQTADGLEGENETIVIQGARKLMKEQNITKNEFEEFVNFCLSYRDEESCGVASTTNSDETCKDSGKITGIGADDVSTSTLKTQVTKSQIDENDETPAKDESMKVSGLSRRQKKNRKNRLKKVNGVINPQIPEDVEDTIEIVGTEGAKEIVDEENRRSMKEQYSVESREPQADLEDKIEFEEDRDDDSHGIDYATSFDESCKDSRKMTEIGADGSPLNDSTSPLKSQIDEKDRTLTKDESMKVSGLSTRQKKNREKPLREVNGVINPQIPEDVVDTIEIVVAEDAKKIINEENGRSMNEKYINSVETRGPQADLEDGIEFDEVIKHRLLYRDDDSHGIDYATSFDETCKDSRKMVEIGADGSPLNASTSPLKSQIDENDSTLAKDESMKVSSLPTRQKNNRENPLGEVNGVINAQIPEDIEDTIEIVVAEDAKKIINEENGRRMNDQYINSVETRGPQADLEDGIEFENASDASTSTSAFKTQVPNSQVGEDDTTSVKDKSLKVAGFTKKQRRNWTRKLNKRARQKQGNNSQIPEYGEETIEIVATECANKITNEGNGSNVEQLDIIPVGGRQLQKPAGNEPDVQSASGSRENEFLDDADCYVWQNYLNTLAASRNQRSVVVNPRYPYDHSNDWGLWLDLQRFRCEDNVQGYVRIVRRHSGDASAVLPKSVKNSEEDGTNRSEDGSVFGEELDISEDGLLAIDENGASAILATSSKDSEENEANRHEYGLVSGEELDISERGPSDIDEDGALAVLPKNSEENETNRNEADLVSREELDISEDALLGIDENGTLAVLPTSSKNSEENEANRHEDGPVSGEELDISEDGPSNIDENGALAILPNSSKNSEENGTNRIDDGPVSGEVLDISEDSPSDIDENDALAILLKSAKNLEESEANRNKDGLVFGEKLDISEDGLLNIDANGALAVVPTSSKNSEKNETNRHADGSISGEELDISEDRSLSIDENGALAILPISSKNSEENEANRLEDAPVSGEELDISEDRPSSIDESGPVSGEELDISEDSPSDIDENDALAILLKSAKNLEESEANRNEDGLVFGEKLDISEDGLLSIDANGALAVVPTSSKNSEKNETNRHADGSISGEELDISEDRSLSIDENGALAILPISSKNSEENEANRLEDAPVSGDELDISEDRLSSIDENGLVSGEELDISEDGPSNIDENGASAFLPNPSKNLEENGTNRVDDGSVSGDDLDISEHSLLGIDENGALATLRTSSKNSEDNEASRHTDGSVSGEELDIPEDGLFGIDENGLESHVTEDFLIEKCAFCGHVAGGEPNMDGRESSLKCEKPKIEDLFGKGTAIDYPLQCIREFRNVRIVFFSIIFLLVFKKAVLYFLIHCSDKVGLLIVFIYMCIYFALHF